MVYAANVETLEVSLKPVLETYIRETSHLVHITVNGEEIVSTFNHPYYVKGQGFVNAVDLCIGYEHWYNVDAENNQLWFFPSSIWLKKDNSEYGAYCNFR